MRQRSKDSSSLVLGFPQHRFDDFGGTAVVAALGKIALQVAKDTLDVPEAGLHVGETQFVEIVLQELDKLSKLLFLGIVQRE